MTVRQDHFIPAGCIRVSFEEIPSEENESSLGELQTWSWFNVREDLAEQEHAEDGNRHEPFLAVSSQRAILKCPALSKYSSLFRARWIKLQFKAATTDPSYGIMRVYLLPDDLHRRTIDRAHPGLKKARLMLLKSLDYSEQAWQGYGMTLTELQQTPPNFDSYDSKEEATTTLLKLFNRIPSPNPKPASVVDWNSQNAIYDLLESKVNGLNTTLFPYQRRSAALMIQREAQPGLVLDPRLMHAKAQDGSSWYMDAVTGAVLLEQRQYDGIAGGILAEEMGSGKTIICLALILATRGLSAEPPPIFGIAETPIRPKIASFADMAASCATRNAVPWKPYFDTYSTGEEGFTPCARVLERNPGYYLRPLPEPRRSGRYVPDRQPLLPPEKIYLSYASLVVVPANLVAQWKEEIQKHTGGIKVLTILKNDDIPPPLDLLRFDMILFSQPRLEHILRQYEDFSMCPLSRIHFKRCIVDEGHKLGNSKMGKRSNLLMVLDMLTISYRWIATGTPSHGLFGQDNSKETQSLTKPAGPTIIPASGGPNESEMEKKDLERIGAIVALYLKARPWANTNLDNSDTLADWATYLMLPKHNPKSKGRWESLRLTLNSLIVRHQLSEISTLLPPVNERIVVLEGSYQDRLSLNLFAMMIISNAVQSQRTGVDYFFHHRQQSSLMLIVHNMKQASFFGGSFYTPDEIATSVETAEKFLDEKKVPISTEDEILLRSAIKVGKEAVQNTLRNVSNQFHDVPISIEGLPAQACQSWALDGEAGDHICTTAGMVLALQKLIYKAAGHPEELNSLLNGGIAQEGDLEKEKLLAAQISSKSSASKAKSETTLAGNTKVGDDSPRKSRSHGVNGVQPKKRHSEELSIGPLQSARITATVSAKLSYLIDNILEHQEREKIIIFYENENTAFYLASMLDVLQIQHLIYARTLSVDRRAQYVDTFHHNPNFRVLLMDLSQAAFGLDMREASRIYFICPVLNPQVEAQAIGRVRRISQQKPVSVETLVLKNSIDEVILERKKHMTQAEHRLAKTILDIRPIYNWMKNAFIVPLGNTNPDNASQMAKLETAQPVFGRGFGRSLHPDEGLVFKEAGSNGGSSINSTDNAKRSFRSISSPSATAVEDGQPQELAERPARRVRFT